MLIDGARFFRRFKVCIAIKTQIRSTVEPICSLSIDECFKYDELEKPLRDLGIINKNSKDISENSWGARNYKNPGGREAAKRDFEKVPGKEQSSNDPDVRVKVLENGERVVLRIKDKRAPTIEMQPKDAGRGSDNTRIKVRYP